jgi:hypothetical protein
MACGSAAEHRFARHRNPREAFESTCLHCSTTLIATSAEALEKAEAAHACPVESERSDPESSLIFARLLALCSAPADGKSGS